MFVRSVNRYSALYLLYSLTVKRARHAKKAAAGVTEVAKTWYGWKMAGFTVKHGSRNLFQVELVAPEKGNGRTFRQSYFGESQVERTNEEAVA